MRVLLAILLVCAVPCVARAATASDEPEPYALQPEARGDFKSGKVAMLKALADAKGPLMSLSLSIFQPVSVTVLSGDKADDIHLRIGKAGLKDIIFDGSTQGTGFVAAKFRSEDEAQVLVTSPAGRKRFNLIVWVGPVMKPRGQSLLRPIGVGQ